MTRARAILLETEQQLIQEDTAGSFWSIVPAYPKPVLLAHFNGPEPPETDYTGDTDADIGRPAIISGGYTHRPGKFGKGIQLAAAVTNMVVNPSGETTGNVATQAPATVTVNSTDYALFGTHSVKVVSVAPHTNAGVAFTTAALTNAQHYASVYLRGSLLAANQLWSLDNTNWNVPGLLGTITDTDGEIWSLYGLLFSAAQANGSTVFRVIQSDATSRTWYVDGAQVEAGVSRTPYCDGTLGTGHTWSGTAHASYSSRTASNLAYLNPLSATAGTIALWWTPSEVLLGADRRLINDGALDLYIESTDSKFTFIPGVSLPATAATALVADTPIHVAATWGASGCALYVNGALAKGTATAPSFTPGAILYVGSNTTGGTNANGVIDDLLILDYAMTAQQVADLYDLGAEINSGDVFDLASMGANVIAQSGSGMPPMTSVTQKLALQDGAQHKRQLAEPRVIQLMADMAGSTYPDWHALRDALIAKINRDQNYDETIRLVYSGMAGVRWIDCRYDAGMEISPPEGFDEQFPLRFVAVDPFWRGASRRVAVSLTSTISAAYIMMRLADGSWNAMGTGLGAATGRCMLRKSNGAVIVGGDFTTPGTRVAMWNGAWTDIASGSGLNGVVHALAYDADGVLYVGGVFTAPSNAMCYYDGTWHAMAGLSGGTVQVECVVVGHDGTVYAGGQQTTPAHFCYWNGAAWAAVGAAGAPANSVKSAAVLPNGHIVTGDNDGKVLKWDGTAWSQLGDTFVNGGAGTLQINMLAVMPNGDIVAGGIFTSPAAYIARWNGSTWLPMGSGANGQVFELYVLSNGDLLAGGAFTTMGGLTLPDSIAIWNGSWVPYSIDLPGAAQIGSTLEADERFYISFDTTGSAVVTGQTVVTNHGGTRAYPRITITGPAAIKSVENITTGERLYFGITALAGETLTLDLSNRTIITFTSTFRGNVMSMIRPGSALSTWHLEPGANQIHVYASGTTAASKMVMTFDERYWSCD